VGGNYRVQINQLNTLEGAPLRSDGDFMCYRNKLKNLIGLPETMTGQTLDCTDNPLDSLIGLPLGLKSLEMSYSPTLPLMRTLTAEQVVFDDYQKWNQGEQVEAVLNRYAGLGKRGMMKCASELLTLGAKLGLDLRANCRW
jgi:hypothetical protein